MEKRIIAAKSAEPAVHILRLTTPVYMLLKFSDDFAMISSGKSWFSGLDERELAKS